MAAITQSNTTIHPLPSPVTTIEHPDEQSLAGHNAQATHKQKNTREKTQAS